MKKSNGFTLIELMVTIAIAAILLTAAVPSFLDSIRKNRLTSQAANIVTALNVARSEAIKLGADVAVCSTTDQATCGGANDWSTGWLVHQGGTVIRVWNALNTGSTLTGDIDTITFTPRGLTTGALTLTLTATGCGPDEQRTINVSLTGRTNITTSDCP